MASEQCQIKYIQEIDTFSKCTLLRHLSKDFSNLFIGQQKLLANTKYEMD